MRLQVARRQHVDRIDALRLKDRVRVPVRILFVGINPGVRSALTGHHFAGFSNRFWQLLCDSGIVPERIRAEDDDRLPEWGCGITNLVARPTPGISTLTPSEYADGVRILRRKVRKWGPQVVALVGVTLFREIFRQNSRGKVALGPQAETLEGVPVFVLANPSGRNANYSYREMLAAFKALEKTARSPKPGA